MKKYFNQTLYSVITLLTLTFGSALLPVYVSAAAPAPPPQSASQQTACNTLNTLNSKEGCGNNGDTGLENVIKEIVDLLSLVVGIIAVIMVIVAGVKFVTSGGDSNAVASARGTLLYAIIGLIVVALAQTIVHIALSASNGSVATT